MGRYCAMPPVGTVQSSHSFFEARMIVKPVHEGKMPKGMEVVKRSALAEYREHKHRW